MEARVLANIKNNSSSGELVERPLLHKNGARLTVMMSCELVSGSPGHFICYYMDITNVCRSTSALQKDGGVVNLNGDCKTPVLYADVTEQALTVQAIRESEERFSTMADSSPVIIYVSDHQGIRYANKTCLEFFGTNLEEMQANGWRNFIHPDELESFFLYCADAASRLENFETEVRVRRYDGAWRWLLVSGAPRLLGDGIFVGYVGVSIDITERKQAEVLLKESEEKYRTVIEGTDEGFWYWDIESDAVFWSERMFELYGQNSMEFVPTREAFFALVHPEDRDVIAEKLQAHLNGLSSFDFEFRAIKPSGEVVYLHNRSKAHRHKQGKAVRIAGMTADITYRKQTEQALLEYKNKLERSNQELEHFATIASHELQEPLRKVQLFSEIIAAHTLPEADDYLKRMQNAVVRMRDLVTDLLALSRVNRKGQPFRKTDLNEVMDTVLSDLELLIQEKNARILGRLIGVIDADQKQIEQLLQNLIHNAIKFTPPEKMPTVHITGYITANGNYQIQVRDEGIGFKQEYGRRIFEPFERLHSRGQYPGTGMGLAICRKIVERHHGQIDADSVPEEGSCFTVTLPVVNGNELIALAAELSG
ncbi:MAG: cph1 [Vampirovibrio sp.]|nr:cph1 [Vampirovibrio sp.]